MLNICFKNIFYINKIKLLLEKKKIYYIYLYISYIYENYTYFDFFSKEFFNNLKYVKYINQILTKNLLILNLNLFSIFDNTKQIKINLNKNNKFIFFKKINFSKKLNLLFESLIQNTFIRFKTFSNTKIFFLNLLFEKYNLKILNNNNKFLLLKYKYLKIIFKNTFFHNKNLIKFLFIFLIRKYISFLTLNNYLSKQKINFGINYFRNNLILSLLQLNLNYIFKKNIYMSINNINWRV